MEPILPVKLYMKSLNGQFVPINFAYILDYDGKEGKVPIEVRRLNDDKIFKIDVDIYGSARMMGDICVIDEVSIDSFHDDFIHVDISVYRHSDDFKYCVGNSDTIEINDIEDYISTLLAEVREDFREKYPEIQD